MKTCFAIFVSIIVLTMSLLYAQDGEIDSIPSQPSQPSMLSTDYWSLRYHPQINDQLFEMVNYPYFPNGRDFARKGKVEIADIYSVTTDTELNKKNFESELLSSISLLIRQLVEDASKTENTQNEAGDQTDSGGNSSDNATEATKSLVNSFTSSETTQPENDINLFRNYLENCSDLIFRWRQINESPTFMLELLRSVKLTETDSGIYQANPDIAVQIKRTIGNIAKINKNFDFTSRITMEAILTGEYPRAWLSRLEKQLADLRNRLILLKDLNDKGSQALGLGDIDRSFDHPKYSDKIIFEIIETPDPYNLK